MQRLPWFRLECRKTLLYKVLEEWKGTPYRHLCAVKGLGADCTLFVWEVMKEVGFIGSNVSNLPKMYGHYDYPKDRAMHSSDEVLLKVLRNIKTLKELSTDNIPETGDICCYKFFKSTSHLSVYYNGYIYQALDRCKVFPTRFDNTKFKKRLSAIFRPMEEII